MPRRRPRFAGFARLGAALVAIGGAFAACSQAPTTGIVIGVSTQTRVPKDLRSVRVVVRSLDQPVKCATFAIDGASGALPQIVAVTGYTGQPIDVQVAGFVEGVAQLPAGDCAMPESPRVLRHARTRLVSGENLYVPMPLQHACFDTPCAADETCAQGACRSAAVDSGTLVRYSDSFVSDTSFCLPPTQCFDGRIPALLVDREACVFQMTNDDTLTRGINVEVVHDDFTREVIDLDPVDGFATVEPDRFRLSPSLCDRYKARKIAAVFVGLSCPSKTVLNPICAPDAKTPVPDGGDVADPAELCTSPADLAPTRSALYVLMDRSRSMRDFFGPKGIGETLDLALASPILRTTLVAFRFLPSAAGDCTLDPNGFAAPAPPDGVSFAPADQARAAIAALVGDASRVDAVDRPLYLDAALRPSGAYQALRDLPGTPFARRELLLLGNRDVASHCAPSVGKVPDLAQSSWLQLGLRSSAILLKPALSTDQQGRDPFLDTITTTRAGAGTFADASFDTKDLRPALLAIVANLATCLYDVPPEIDTTHALTTTKVSYFDFIGSKRVDVAFNPACSESQGTDGWNIDRGRVRLCGKACFDVRYMFGFGATYAMDRHVAPPDVVVKWAPRCP